MTKTQFCIHHYGLKPTGSAHRHAADGPMLALTCGEPLPAGARFRTCTPRYTEPRAVGERPAALARGIHQVREHVRHLLSQVSRLLFADAFLEFERKHP
jgi:hypothetical protein